MFRDVRFAMLLALAFISGCALFAKKPPTPAAEITPEQAATIVAPPGERYFIVVFGSQSTPKQAKYTHTWATVLRVNNYDGTGRRLSKRRRSVGCPPRSISTPMLAARKRESRFAHDR